MSDEYLLKYLIQSPRVTTKMADYSHSNERHDSHSLFP